MLVHAGHPVRGARVGVLGLTFKENVSDLRNSRVPDVMRELSEFGMTPFVHDPLASADEARHEYGLELARLEDFTELDALVYAVPHRAYRELGPDAIWGMLAEGGAVIDVRSALDPKSAPESLHYYSL